MVLENIKSVTPSVALVTWAVKVPTPMKVVNADQDAKTLYGLTRTRTSPKVAAAGCSRGKLGIRDCIGHICPAVDPRAFCNSQKKLKASRGGVQLLRLWKHMARRPWRLYPLLKARSWERGPRQRRCQKKCRWFRVGYSHDQSSDLVFNFMSRLTTKVESTVENLSKQTVRMDGKHCTKI